MSRLRRGWPPYPMTALERAAIVLGPEVVLVAGLLGSSSWWFAVTMSAAAVLVHVGAVLSLRPKRLAIIQRTRAAVRNRTVSAAYRFLLWATEEPRLTVVAAILRSRLERAVNGPLSESASFELGEHRWRFVDVSQTRWTLQWLVDDEWVLVSTTSATARLPRT